MTDRWNAFKQIMQSLGQQYPEFKDKIDQALQAAQEKQQRDRVSN